MTHTIEDMKSGRHGARLIFETVAGSHAYGTNTPQSDVDIRGIFIHPPDAYLGLTTPSEQIHNDKQDIVYYSLKKFFSLAKDCNPNIIELLWMPQDCIQLRTPEMDLLMSDQWRNAFISKRCFYTFSGYAYSQIKKAKGQNKRINNPKPERRPQKEDFCYIIEKVERDISGKVYTFPVRPVRISDRDYKINLSKYHAAQVERTNNLFRLYYYPECAKGVFRGDDMVTCENIPIDDEDSRFSYLMLYNSSEYESELREWSQYWEWMKNRNESRWAIQEGDTDEIRYDRKNMHHCMRLLISSSSILEHGYPIVRFSGSDLEYLRNIRDGKFKYEEIIGEVERRMEYLKVSYDSNNMIPNSVDFHRIESMYRQLVTS